MNPKNNLRTFICIDFPDEVIKEIARLQNLIYKQKFVGKLTELENLHVTLKFLGEIPEETINKVKEKLKEIKFPELNLKIGEAGTFSIKRNPRIVWIKIKGDIFNLQKQIDKSLNDLFPEEKRFMSHLTIARIKYTKNSEGFREYISKLKPKKLQFKTNSFKLKTSELTPKGPIYTIVEEFRSKNI